MNAKQVHDIAAPIVANLCGRWQDEKEYEDFSDYSTVMEKSVKDLDGVKFLGATMRPFGFKFETKGEYTTNVYRTFVRGGSVVTESYRPTKRRTREEIKRANFVLYD